MRGIDLNRFLNWAKPIATILLGIVLLMHPDSVTKTAAICTGGFIAVIGIGLLISYFGGMSKGDFFRLCCGIIILCVGISILKNPMALPRRMSRFIGVILVLESLRQLTSTWPTRSRTISAILGIIGVTLILVPMSASWLMSVGIGILVLLLGAGMLADRIWTERHIPVPPEDRIVDAL